MMKDGKDEMTLADVLAALDIVYAPVTEFPQDFLDDLAEVLDQYNMSLDDFSQKCHNILARAGVEACVSFERFSPWKSTSELRPSVAGRLSGSLFEILRWFLCFEAQASMRVKTGY